MNKEDVLYFAAVIGEESGEVSQVVGKIHRFGPNDIHPKRGISNIEHLHQEIHDVLGAYKLLCKELGVPFIIEDELIDAKMDKILRIKEEHP